MTAYINLNLQLNIYFFKNYFQGPKSFNKPYGKYKMSPDYRHTNNSEIQSQIDPNISEQNNQKPNKIQDRHLSHHIFSSLLHNRTFLTACQASTATLFMVYKMPLTY